MGATLVARIVGFSARQAWLVVLCALLFAAWALPYARNHFAMDSRTESLISAQTQWRKREAVYNLAFPQNEEQEIDIVVDGATPERAEEAVDTLTAALRTRPKLLPIVRQPDNGAFFSHDGLLFLSEASVKDATQKLVKAQPFLGGLAIDPSLRGIADNLSTALMGVQHGQAKLADLDAPILAFARTLDANLAGRNEFLSWRSMMTGARPSLRETRRFIEVVPKLDYTALTPGRQATNAIRKTVSDLGLTPANGVRVRLTGPVPMTDEEFGSLTHRVGLMATLMMIAVLTMLWLALRSIRLIFSVLLTVLVGLAATTAAGLVAVGSFNPISVAFIALFVGLGVDFGIQFCVRYRAERYAVDDLDTALVRAGHGVGSALALAAAATAAGFFSFLPTSYIGVAELGFVAGLGMLITLFLSITLLPALVKLVAPPGEPEEVGFRAFAHLDRFFERRKRLILIAAAVLVLAASALLPFVEFDFNPLNLRDPKAESVSTIFDLMKSPETSPNTINALARSSAAADKVAARLRALPDVARVLTINSFVPDDQAEKIATISDADAILDPTINPFTTKPPPTDAETKASLRATAADLKTAAGSDDSQPARDARDLAAAFIRLSNADEAMRARVANAFVPGLKTMLDDVRASLTPFPVTVATLPADMVRDWVSTRGLYRVEAFPKADANDNEGLKAFTAAVRHVVPDAIGLPILIQESGRTIVRAFLQAGVLSFISIAILLYLALRSFALVSLALGPLLLSGVLTLASCVVIGLSLNYANIIALPLLLGIGVAFDIYFVMAWRSGARNLLASALTRAVILSAGTTASAFGTLWISSHRGTASMGELLAISLVWILVTVLFMLPALLAYAVPRLGLKPKSPD